MALDGILRNFPVPAIGTLLRPIIFPLGRRHRLPSDSLNRKVARAVVDQGPARDRLTSAIFLSEDPKDQTGRMDDAYNKASAAKPIRARLRQAGIRQPERIEYAKWLTQLVKEEHIDAEEKKILIAADKAVMAVIQVDDFKPGKQQIKYKK